MEAFQGIREIHAWTTDLIRGGPLSGVKVMITEKVEQPSDPFANHVDSPSRKRFFFFT